MVVVDYPVMGIGILDSPIGEYRGMVYMDMVIHPEYDKCVKEANGKLVIGNV